MKIDDNHSFDTSDLSFDEMEIHEFTFILHIPPETNLLQLWDAHHILDMTPVLEL